MASFSEAVRKLFQRAILTACHSAEAYPWSSVAAHISGRGNDLVKVKPLLEMVGNWRDFLLSGMSKKEIERIRRHEKTGRALEDDRFVGKLEGALGRILQRQKPGPKKGA